MSSDIYRKQAQSHQAEIARLQNAEAQETARVTDRPLLEKIVARVPKDWMTPLAREFAVALLCYNLEECRKIQL